MAMLNVYILEDELNIVKYIWSILDEIPYVRIVGHSGEMAKAEQEIYEKSPNLILADIQLKDGVSFELLSRLNLDVHLLFITAYSQYAIEALNIGAIGYLTKPIDAICLTETIQKCFEKTQEFKFNQNQLLMADRHMKTPAIPQKIALKTFEFTQIINIDDIVYCLGDKGYTTFFMRSGDHLLVSKVLKHFEGMLPESQFIRCHQSYLINTHYIHKYYKDGQLEMQDGKLIPVSNRKRDIIAQYIDTLS
ncbi:LytTR family DNA-binding domain-containing protein [Sphingobacterium sp. KU25419]|uniref:LytR/AlgR family response regulator transcription factor n=1 Tax=Sphingobacterium faecium TaxID=34087 RepID=UPI002377A0F7|nr:LytTR family DNA-binding domain-containing protein [Sphingobacterium sp. KU25419]